MKKLLVFMMIIAMLVCQAGCANIKDDGTRTRTEGTLVGGGIGAAVGAGIGALLGGGRGALIGAAIGAGVGSLTGLAVGNHVANQKAKYAKEEDWLDACIAEAQKVNAEIEQYNANLQTDIENLDKATAMLAAQYKKNQASKSVLDAQAKQISTRQNEVAQNIQILENEIGNQRNAVADARKNNKTEAADSLDREIAKMQKQIDLLKQRQARLASISNRVAS